MYKTKILPLAKVDISEAATWYNDQQKGLGKRFTKEVRSKILFLSQNPMSSSIRYDEVRCAVLSIFPFMIHYFIEEANKTIVIVTVSHTSLNPERWQKARKT